MPKLLTTTEAAAWLQVSESLLEHDVGTARLGVPYVRIGRSVRYRQEALEQWARDHECAPESPREFARRLDKVRLLRGAARQGSMAR